MNRRTTLLIIAALFGLGVGLLLFNYLVSANRPGQSAPPRSVLLAARAIPARVRITAAMLRTVLRPANAVEPDAISAPAAAIGTIALIDIPVGGTITNSEITRGVVNALPVTLRDGMRAVSIPITAVKGVSGLLQAGDHVDVIAIPPLNGHRHPVAETFLRDVRVLAVGNSLESSSATPSPNQLQARTVTLEVTPKEADMLAAADVNTILRLALRSPREAANSEPAEELVIPKMVRIRNSRHPAGPAHSGVVVIAGDAVQK